MKLKHTLAGVTALALCASAAQAQNLALNEIYASHAGLDDQEFIEIKGPANFNLANCVVLIVEGEGPNKGILDRAWDLTGFSIPTDGYFVLGNTLVANIDIDIGSDNIIENGTETFYLVLAPNPAAILALVGTDVDMNDDCVVDFISGVTIRDYVAMVDDDFPGTDDFTDAVYDAAEPIGPDGSFFPAGIFRQGDAPNPWCHTTFLDFDDVANVAEPRTPGVANTAVCAAGAPGTAYCFGTFCPCANDDATAGCANSTGVGGILSGSGSNSVTADDLVLTASQLPPMNNGLFYMGNKALKNPFFDGFQCALGSTLRFLNDIQNTGAGGTMTLGPNIVFKSGGLIMPGTTWYFHAWHRDVPGSPCSTGANLTHLYGVSFVP